MSKRKPSRGDGEAEPDGEPPRRGSRGSSRSAEQVWRRYQLQLAGPREALNFRFTGQVNLIARRYRTRVNEVLRTIGQSQARWDALFWISASDGGATQSELAELIGVEGPTLVRMLHRLEGDGLVERRGAVGDRRAKTIRLRPDAEELLLRIAELTSSFRDELLKEIPEDELEACLSVLERVMERLERV